MASTGDKNDKNLHTYKEMTVVEPLERRERYKHINLIKY